MPPTMVKRRKQEPPLDPQPEPEKKKDLHKNPGWTLRIPQKYKERLKQSAKKNRRTASEEAKIAFEEYLKKQGLWTEQDETDER